MIRFSAQGANLLLAPQGGRLFRQGAYSGQGACLMFWETTTCLKQNDQQSNRHKIIRRAHSFKRSIYSHGHNSWETQTVFVMHYCIIALLRMSAYRKMNHIWYAPVFWRHCTVVKCQKQHHKVGNKTNSRAISKCCCLCLFGLCPTLRSLRRIYLCLVNDNFYEPWFKIHWSLNKSEKY